MFSLYPLKTIAWCEILWLLKEIPVLFFKNALKVGAVLPVCPPHPQHLSHNSAWQETKRRGKVKATDAATAQCNILAVTASCSQTSDWHCGQAGTCSLICVFARLESLFAQLLPFSFFFLKQHRNLSGIILCVISVADTCMMKLLHPKKNNKGFP